MGQNYRMKTVKTIPTFRDILIFFLPVIDQKLYNIHQILKGIKL